jgi:ribonuclease HI
MQTGREQQRSRSRRGGNGNSGSRSRATKESGERSTASGTTKSPTQEAWKWQGNLLWSRGWAGEKEEQAVAKRVGAGFTVRRGEETIMERSIGLRSQAEVFDAELLAIVDATSEACKYAGENDIPNITVCSDSAAAIAAITSTKTHGGQRHTLQIRKNILGFLEAANQNTVTLRWVPAHVGIPGNERADCLAKAGTILPPKQGLPKTTQAHIKRTLKEHLLRSFENHAAKGRYWSRYHSILLKGTLKWLCFMPEVVGILV